MTGLARAVRTVVAPLPRRGAGRERARRRRRATAGGGGGAAPRGPGGAGRRGPRRHVPAREPRRRAAAADRRRRSPPCDVFIAPTSRSLSHTQARKRATDNGARGATMPTRHGGHAARLMDVDFDVLARAVAAVADLLTEADEAHVTCPRGHRPALWTLTGRQGIADDGDLTAPGSFGNLPCGEGFIAPLIGEGTVATRSLASIGIVQGHPAHLTVEDGRLTRPTGPRASASRAAHRRRRAGHEPGRARRRDQRPRAADRQHPRGREDPRHRPRRLRRQRGHRRHGRRSRSTSTSWSIDATLTIGDTTVLDARALRPRVACP